jgi:hypothetical protein
MAAASGWKAGDSDPYWHHRFMGSLTRYDRFSADLADILSPVSRDPVAVSSLRLDRLKPPNSDVIADIWSGLSAGDWLVARRAVSFDALVQVGVIVITRGPDDYHGAFAAATANLDFELAEALDRRIRFVGIVMNEADRFDRPSLSLYDSGLHAYR